MRFRWPFTYIIVGCTLITIGLLVFPDHSPTRAQEGDGVPPTTADHSQYEILQQDFETGPDVTEACLTCHNQADAQFHATVHWNWAYEHPETGEQLGKRHLIDNHVLSITDNEAYCATCHNGYGFDGPDYDFEASVNIDCLSCHDTTGEYEKLPGAAGHPAYEPTEYPPGSGTIWEPPDLTRIAQNVGSTSRQSCGSCHFGDRNVNPFVHGSLPAALGDDPSPELDVHMGTDFLDFSCATCHEPQQHDFISSNYYPVSARDMRDSHMVQATCVNCHDADDVHDDRYLTQHTERIACQTCHVPSYARGEPQMVRWDWSEAGRTDEDGNPIVERNEDDLLVYHGHYGAFEWDQDITPRYVWFNSIITFTTVGEEIDPNGVVQVNQYEGSYEDGESLLWPLRVYEGVQPYDTENNILLAVNLYGEEDDAFWQNEDWAAALDSAMQSVDAPYSGNYGFVETEMAWPLNHMVAPASEALACAECHQQDGILADLSGAYVPGRDRNDVIDLIGRLLAVGAVVGVVAHGGLRVVAYQRRADKDEDES